MWPGAKTESSAGLRKIASLALISLTNAWVPRPSPGIANACVRLARIPDLPWIVGGAFVVERTVDQPRQVDLRLPVQHVLRLGIVHPVGVEVALDLDRGQVAGLFQVGGHFAVVDR